jgi:ribosomal protein L32
VNVNHTDWYATDYFQCSVGDRINIHVDVAGGSAKLVVREQGGGTIYGEVHGVFLYFDVPVNSYGIYRVEIWTRAVPFPSTFVDLAGTVSLMRINYPMVYVAYGALLSGLVIVIGVVSFYLYRRHKIGQEKEELKRLRVCPKCRQRVPIENTVCPHCGLDITRSVQCGYCHAFYDRSLSKCPNCGAKRT